MRSRSLPVLLCLLAAPLSAQILAPGPRLEAWEQVAALRANAPTKAVAWQHLGPTNISGRVTDVAVATPRSKHNTIYVATASGGLWKTTNDGTTWTAVFDQGPSTSIGDVTLDPSNPEIVWMGTGEPNIFRSSQAGIGVYRSPDGGKTWSHLGLGGTHTIARILVSPKDGNTVYVAASGHEWTDNPDRGVYKTTDGGKTWQKVLFVSDQAGAIDLVMDAKDPETIYASTWQRKRLKWNDPRNTPETKDSGLWKTTDGGKTWKPINAGLPSPAHRGRIGLAQAESNPKVLYAFVDNYELTENKGGRDAYGRPMAQRIRGFSIFRTDDAGATWRQMSANDDANLGRSGTYGWVFAQVRVDPTNENRVFAMGLALNVSEDGGKTWKTLGSRQIHSDHHALWIDPENPKVMVNGNDGGCYISYDRGQNWRFFVEGLNPVQFYNVAFDMGTPFKVYGSIQDHFSYRGVVDLSKGRNKIPAVAWESTPGGEGCTHQVDPTDPNTVYSAAFYGQITRSDMTKKGRDRDLNILPKVGKDEPPLRGQWVAPFILSPHDPKTIYHGMQYVFRSTNRGDSWERISPDLTLNDPKTLGDISYHTLFALCESPLQKGLLYAGTDDGRAHVTQDGGKTWTEITAGLAKDRWISRMEASPFDRDTVYLSQNGKRDDDFAAYLWRSRDCGKTWQSIAKGIPLGPINVVRADPALKGVLYVGTDNSVFMSKDEGQSWEALGGALPSTYVHDLAVHPRDRILVAATHGRGMWALDLQAVHSAK